MIVAIDGPAGAGKSTIAKLVAKAVDFGYVDTGAMYRAVTLKALRDKTHLEDEAALARLARDSEIATRGHEIFLDGENVSKEIRSPAVGEAVSIVSRVKDVRTCLVEKQRALAESLGDLVMEGRDIGTVVFPSARVKVFLTAAVAERARRRWQELTEGGLAATAPSVDREIKERDRLDSGRAVSPLEPAADAHVIDTTEKSIDEVVQLVLDLIGR